jgi:hypothetical protein
MMVAARVCISLHRSGRNNAKGERERKYASYHLTFSPFLCRAAKADKESAPSSMAIERVARTTASSRERPASWLD